MTVANNSKKCKTMHCLLQAAAPMCRQTASQTMAANNSHKQCSLKCCQRCLICLVLAKFSQTFQHWMLAGGTPWWDETWANWSSALGCSWVLPTTPVAWLVVGSLKQFVLTPSGKNAQMGLVQGEPFGKSQRMPVVGPYQLCEWTRNHQLQAVPKLCQPLQWPGLLLVLWNNLFNWGKAAPMELVKVEALRSFHHSRLLKNNKSAAWSCWGNEWFILAACNLLSCKMQWQVPALMELVKVENLRSFHSRQPKKIKIHCLILLRQCNNDNAIWNN